MPIKPSTVFLCASLRLAPSAKYGLSCPVMTTLSSSSSTGVICASTFGFCTSLISASTCGRSPSAFSSASGCPSVPLPVSGCPSPSKLFSAADGNTVWVLPADMPTTPASSKTTYFFHLFFIFSPSNLISFLPIQIRCAVSYIRFLHHW